ncbi:hypothetical protein VTL71DRAFT_196 [Oculimacula yallundae]|uniref:Uncharacterized protein n=1 Tax=Oculimacula yallundae TaxID=86028 RepID=A0ABR4CZH0_9HELO
MRYSKQGHSIATSVPFLRHNSSTSLKDYLSRFSCNIDSQTDRATHKIVWDINEDNLAPQSLGEYENEQRELADMDDNDESEVGGGSDADHAVSGDEDGSGTGDDDDELNYQDDNASSEASGEEQDLLAGDDDDVGDSRTPAGNVTDAIEGRLLHQDDSAHPDRCGSTR